MGFVTGLVVYVIVWWLVLFTVLPWGVQVPDEAERGMADSAPEKPRLWLKVAITTAIAAVLWLGIYLVIDSGWISFRPG